LKDYIYETVLGHEEKEAIKIASREGRGSPLIAYWHTCHAIDYG
jgi:hypothetical protein